MEKQTRHDCGESEEVDSSVGGCHVPTCISCGEHCVSSDVCSGCGLPCHPSAPCAFPSEQVEGESVICSLCHRQRIIHVEQRATKRKQMQQADVMTERSVKRFKPAEIGDTVMIPVPLVDRGRAEMPNVKAVVVSLQDGGLYKLGTQHGLLNQLYSRNEFSPCVEKFMTVGEVAQGKNISLREVAGLEAIGTGQGFAKCSCTTTCSSHRRKCFKNSVNCNSRCRCSHKSSNK